MKEGTDKKYQACLIGYSDFVFKKFIKVFGENLEICRCGKFSPDCNPADYDIFIINHSPSGIDAVPILKEIREKSQFTAVIACLEETDNKTIDDLYEAGADNCFIINDSFYKNCRIFLNSIDRAVKKQKQFFLLENLIDFNPYCIEIFDHNGRMVRLNKSALDIHGTIMPPELTVFDLPKITQCSSEFIGLLEKMKTGADYLIFPPIWLDVKTIMPGVKSRPICAAGQVFTIKNSKKEVEYYVLMNEDVTAQVNAEDELKKANAKLEEIQSDLENKVKERTKELSEANSRLQEEIETRKKLLVEIENKNKELENFASRVSHDLRNNLEVLKRLVEYSQINPEMMGEILNSLADSTDHLMFFVKRLLDLARAGKIIDKKEKFNISPITKYLFRYIKPDNIDAEIIINPENPEMVFDPMGFENIISNLINNSFQYKTPDKKLIVEIKAENNGEKTILTYKDNGLGIEESNLDKIFDPAYTTNKRERFGFGLSIVKKIVEAHKGKVEAISGGKGKGIEFILEIPQMD